MIAKGPRVKHRWFYHHFPGTICIILYPGWQPIRRISRSICCGWEISGQRSTRRRSGRGGGGRSSLWRGLLGFTMFKRYNRYMLRSPNTIGIVVLDLMTPYRLWFFWICRLKPPITGRWFQFDPWDQLRQADHGHGECLLRLFGHLA